MAKLVPSSDFPADIKELRNAVKAMDSLSQQGFSEISAIAKLALAYLESPDGYRHPETIAHALRVISCKAEDIDNCINSQADQVGCNYVDEAQGRRWAARDAVLQQQATTEA